MPAHPNLLRLDVFAELCARMAGGESRAQVLASAAVDENLYDMSQEFWLQRMAEDARRGNDALSRRYGELFMAAQRRQLLPTQPSARRWRLSAPGPVVRRMPSVAPSVSAPAAVSAHAAVDAPAERDAYASRLTLEQLAALRAELALAADSEHDAVRQRFGLDAATWEKEEAHWQRTLAGDESLFQRYVRQFQYCKALLQPRG